MPSTKSLRVLVQVDWPTGAIDRLWDGGGPFVDGEGELWRGSTLAEGLDTIEQAINGEAFTLNLTLTNVSSEQAALHWQSYTNDEIVGGIVKIMIQPCDEMDRPVGDREVMFTGRIDNVVFDDSISGDRPVSAITVEVTNRFTLRRMKSGSVLSDADQRARSAALNPDEDPDRFCERVSLLQDKTITWPRWN